MFLFFGIVAGIIFFISSGIFLFFITTIFQISFTLNFILFWGLNLGAFLLIPRQAAYFYRKGVIQASLSLLYLYGVLLAGKKRLRKIVGEIIWQHMDYGNDHKVAMLLARFGQGEDSVSTQYSLSYARYLLRNSNDANTSLRISESILSNKNSARGWFIRGVSFYKLGKYKDAIRSLERAREYSARDKDIILNGTSYFYLGLSWRKIDNSDYAQDHILKASVILGKLPVGKEASRRV